MFDEKKIEEILSEWRNHGEETLKQAVGMPRHPEYIYRLTGDWQGWNHMFGVLPEDVVNYRQNLEQDRLEDEAFRRLQAEKWKKMC